MEKSWSNIADNFDEIQEYVTGREIDAQIKAELSTLKNLGNVLEVACGNGNYTRALAQNSSSLLASDISEDMLRRAKEKLKDLDLISFAKLDCYHTGLESHTYDTVFMGNIIHVVHEPKKALKEASRVLKPNGKLVIISFTADGLSFLSKLTLAYRYVKDMGKPPAKATKFGLNSLKEFVLANGFCIEKAKLLGNKKSKAIFIVARKK